MTAVYFHLVPFGLEKTVIDAQLVTPMLKLREEGLEVTLLMFESPAAWSRLLLPSVREAAMRRLKGLRVKFLPRVPRNFLFLNTLLIGLTLFQSHRRGRMVVVHTRGLQGAAWVAGLKKLYKRLRLICDVRGLEAEEYLYSAEKRTGRVTPLQKWWGGRLSKISRRALLRADMRFCVSDAMIEHLVRWTGLGEEGQWERIPCAVDVDRFSSALASRSEKRADLGLKNKLVVVYSGAVRDWQMPEESVELFKKIQERDPRAFLMVLTPDTDAFKSLLSAKGIAEGCALVKRVPFDDMPAYLSAGDVGLLLREENPLNFYACPTKFAEYLACGLHVLATLAIKDVADVIRTERVGTLITDITDTQKVSEALEAALRVSELEMTRIERSVSLSQRLYDWGSYIPILKKSYLRLSQLS